MANKDFYTRETQPGAGKESSKLAPKKVPSHIGPYKIESLLESGGMSYLYLATNPETKESVAIKVLSEKFLDNEEAKRRFIHEGEIISIADHPAIVTHYAHGEWEGGVYLAMEFVQGVSLRKFIQHTPLSLKKAIEVTLQVAYAVCHLHTHGVIHRDLKPENILITESNHVKLIDFGIAKRLEESHEKDVQERPKFIGTPSYMSPEQRQNPFQVSYPSDVYSLGIIAYELVLGKLSHGHVHLSLMPKGLQKILRKMLQPNPEERYSDLVDVIEDLSNYLETLGTSKEESSVLPEAIESLQSAIGKLASPALPQIEGIEMGCIFHKAVGIAPLYYNFSEGFEGQFHLLVAEPSTKTAQGAIEMANFRGLERAIRSDKKTHKEFVDELNTLTQQDSIHAEFDLASLQLDARSKNFSYFSFGKNQLLVVDPNNKMHQSFGGEDPMLGSDASTPEEVTGHIKEGQFLIIDTSKELSAILEKEESLYQEFLEAKDLSALSERLLRKIQGQLSGEFTTKPIFLFVAQ